MEISSFDSFANVSDKNVDERLIPDLLRGATNSNEIDYCIKAIGIAMETRLNWEQRSLIYEYYWQNMSKRQMAKKRGVVHSTVIKRMKVAQEKLKDYTEFSLLVYREHIKED